MGGVVTIRVRVTIVLHWKLSTYTALIVCAFAVNKCGVKALAVH